MFTKMGLTKKVRPGLGDLDFGPCVFLVFCLQEVDNLVLVSVRPSDGVGEATLSTHLSRCELVAEVGFKLFQIEIIKIPNLEKFDS